VNPLSWLQTIGMVVTTVAEIVDLIRWLSGDGADYPRPVVLTKVPATTQSAAIRIRARAKAAAAFGAGPPT
jgi:hypothetical protein